MARFLQRLLASKFAARPSSGEEAQSVELQHDLEVAQTRIAELEDDLQAMEAELAKAELEGLNTSLGDRDQSLQQALTDATRSNDEKDQMFSSVTRAIEEINECLTIAATSCQENSTASREAGTAADSALTEATAMADRASEIVDVSSAIRAVADRTRLLSLNAKIEASKAHEFGRGFSVVADEVKRLSQEASDASETIAKVAGAIEISTQKVRQLITDVRETTGKVNKSSDRIVLTAKRQETAINQLLAEIGEKHGGDVDLF